MLSNLFPCVTFLQYECLVEGCPLKFQTYGSRGTIQVYFVYSFRTPFSDADRKKHLVDLHKYPKNFFFHPRRWRKKQNFKAKMQRKKEKKQRMMALMVEQTADLLSQMDVDKKQTENIPPSVIIASEKEGEAGSSEVSMAAEELRVVVIEEGERLETPMQQAPTEEEGAHSGETLGESGVPRRVYACKIPDSLSFGGRGRGRGRGYGGKGRGFDIMPTDEPNAGGRGRGRGRGRGKGKGQGKEKGKGKGRGRGGGKGKEKEDKAVVMES